ncbi:biopolymer transporter ExbB [Paracoccus sp. 1_MG-2023]|nr:MULTISPECIES: biopolymer transporter ExbB [unclassified Paracoccus (in: a-proteobacteria)]MBU2959060.1 biopolymer transporter ExbB [Paracoccus sp. C2R09]MDO6669033.1 biopolymer transporter ExbB [Paracoccus sp. 1_MG-2023]
MAGAVQPRFSQPVRQILLMLSVLALVLAGAWLAYGRILPIFMANRWLNGVIVVVFATGVLACFWQLAQLTRSVSWIEGFAAKRSGGQVEPVGQAPRLLAPLAALLGTRGPVGDAISTGSARSILDSVATRIDELRDITRYLSNLLIFLGLLGTFYGLATTVPAVVDTIRALAPQDGESGIEVFDKLMTGLEAQLGGMATAFSSSLLGLAGSLVVGLLELFVTHGQNRFYRELEEWMSSFTRIGQGDAADEAAIGGLLDQMSRQMDRLQGWQSERDQIRDETALMADERVVVMAQAIEQLIERKDGMDGDRLAQALERIATGQDALLAEARAPKPATDWDRIETGIQRLVDEMNEGRDEVVAELRSDILVLTRAVRAARFGDPFRDDLLPADPLTAQDRG